MKKPVDIIEIIHTPKNNIDIQTWSIYFRPYKSAGASINCVEFVTNKIEHGTLKKGVKYLITYSISDWKKSYTARIILKNIHNGDEHLEWCFCDGVNIEDARRNAERQFHPKDRLFHDGKPFLECVGVYDIAETNSNPYKL